MKNNRYISYVIATFLFAGCGASGLVSSETVNAQSSSESDVTAVPESTPELGLVKQELPGFQYIGMDQAARICAEEANSRFGILDNDSDVMIPANVIVGVDESDLSNITVTATIYAFKYRLEGDNLLCVNEEVFPCRIHVRIKDGEGSEIFEVETNDKVTLLDMCNGDEEAAKKMVDTSVMEEVRKGYLSMYVMNYDLPIKTYQDLDSEPIEIPNGDNWID